MVLIHNFENTANYLNRQEGFTLVIQANIMYIIAINALAIFLGTRRILKNSQQDEVTQREKMYHGFNVLGFVACIFYVLSLLLLESLFFTIPQFDLFLVDFFSVHPIVYLAQGSTFVLAFFIGYGLDPRESYAPINGVSDRWVSLIAFLTLFTGGLGLFTGILI
jgi:hypothetical protein